MTILRIIAPPLPGLLSGSPGCRPGFGLGQLAGVRLDLAPVCRLAFGAAPGAGLGLARLAGDDFVAPCGVRLVAGGNLLFALRQVTRFFFGIGGGLCLARSKLLALDLALHLVGFALLRPACLTNPKLFVTRLVDTVVDQEFCLADEAAPLELSVGRTLPLRGLGFERGGPLQAGVPISFVGQRDATRQQEDSKGCKVSIFHAMDPGNGGISGQTRPAMQEF